MGIEKNVVNLTGYGIIGDFQFRQRGLFAVCVLNTQFCELHLACRELYK